MLRCVLKRQAMELADGPLMGTTADGDVVGLTSHTLDELKYISYVRDSAAGAISVFVGTTRDSFEGRWSCMMGAIAETG